MVRTIGRSISIFITIGVGIFLAGCQKIPVNQSLSISSKAGDDALFHSVVRGVLEHRCIHCHNDTVSNGGLNLQDRELVFKGDQDGPFLIPGKPDESRIWKAIILPHKHPDGMPPDGWGLETEDLRAFLKWIQQGAKWPRGAEGELKILDPAAEIMDHLETMSKRY